MYVNVPGQLTLLEDDLGYLTKLQARRLHKSVHAIVFCARPFENWTHTEIDDGVCDEVETLSDFHTYP